MRGWIRYEVIGKPNIMMRIVKEEFQFSKAKLDRKGEEGRQNIEMEYFSIDIWDGSELKLAWFGKNSSYFENNFLIDL